LFSTAGLLCKSIPRQGRAASFSSPAILVRLLRELARLPLALLALYAAAASTSAANTQAEQPAVYDTGYEIISLITTRSLYWLDNERLLFFGMKASRGPRSDLRKLYIWDSKTKMLRFYADGLSLCFSNGFISYRVHVDKEARLETVREGPFGSEREMVRPFPPKGALHSNVTCRTHLRSDLVPTPSPQHVVAILREGDGFLDVGPHVGAALDERDAPMRNVVLHQVTGRAIQLPMTWEEGFSSFVTYSEYRNAYVLAPRAPRGTPIGISGPWPKGKPLRAYLLRADGATEAIAIPYSPSEYLGIPQPLKPGWIYGGGNFYRTLGLYLFSGTTISKLDVGMVKEISVSPDGCKAAVGIQNDHLHMGTPTNLKVFDFCGSRP
jgi:hypothetical protein